MKFQGVYMLRHVTEMAGPGQVLRVLNIQGKEEDQAGDPS